MGNPFVYEKIIVESLNKSSVRHKSIDYEHDRSTIGKIWCADTYYQRSV